jgi:hypothetical protein
MGVFLSRENMLLCRPQRDGLPILNATASVTADGYQPLTG